MTFDFWDPYNRVGTLPFVVCVLSGVLGCAGDSEVESAPVDPPVEEASVSVGEVSVVELSGTLLSEAPAIGQPILMQNVGDALWIADMAKDPSLHQLNAVTGGLVRSYGASGDGPGDFAVRPWSLALRPGDENGVWAFDPGLQRLTRYTADADTLTLIKLTSDAPVQHVAWVSRDRILAIRRSEDRRFEFFDSTGASRGSAPGDPFGPAAAPPAERIEALQATKLCEWPPGGVVIAHRYAGRIEVRDPSGALLRLADTPDQSEPVFEPDDAGALRFVRSSYRYVDCKVTGQRLYALYSGRPMFTIETSASGMPVAPPIEERFRALGGRDVHVFDWNGALVAHYVLPRDAHAISVGADGSRLYTASLLDASIWEYVIPTAAVSTASGGE